MMVSIWRLRKFITAPDDQIMTAGVQISCVSHPDLARSIRDIECPYPGRSDAMTLAMEQLEQHFGAMVSSVPHDDGRIDPLGEFIVVIRHRESAQAPHHPESVDESCGIDRSSHRI